MMTKDDLKEGLDVELLENLPGRDKGLTGTIKDLESVDYDISAVWIFWTEIGKGDHFDLSNEPNILSKIKIKA